jgi:gliding motility-associated-like protein
VSETITVIDYPLYFTPNGDGVNDRWNIVGLNNQPSAKIYIFDRYGKLLKQLSPVGSGWDGTFNGQLMPSNDYWFTVEYQEPNTGETQEFKAHFTLKR